MGVLDDLPRPEMMAIGDSLYNGVRSLTISNKLAQLSAPALVAEALGIRDRFSCPDYGRPMLIDMEQYLHMLPDIDGIKNDVIANFAHWQGAPKPASGRVTFENLSIASTVYRDLFERTAATAQAKLDEINVGRISGIDEIVAHLSDLYFAFNTRFVLNPQGVAELKGMSMLDIVARRRPKVLLVNIGSNDGLWSMGFDCDGTRSYAAARPDLDELVGRLTTLPADIDIYFNGLALPSTVANLMPTDYYAINDRPPPGGYYTAYENAFSTGSYGTFDKVRMAALDADVRAHNDYTAGKIAGSGRANFRFVDVASVLIRLNAKHQADTPANGLRMADGKRFTNLMLEAAPFPLPAFRSGGLQSLDGMHLSTLGYGLMAQQVLDTMGNGRTLNLEGVYQRDDLLQQMPRIWSVALWIWRDIRRARHHGDVDPTRAGHEEAMVGALMDMTAKFKVS